MAVMKLKHALSCFALVYAAFAIQIPSEEQRRDPAVWETIQQPLHNDDVSILANINIPTADVICPMDGIDYTFTIAKIGISLNRAQACNDGPPPPPNCNCADIGKPKLPKTYYNGNGVDGAKLFPEGSPCYGATMYEFPTISRGGIDPNDTWVYCKNAPGMVRVIYKLTGDDYDYCGIIYHPAGESTLFKRCHKR